ncbi:hypothetical protein G6011_07450 [Alternaria panax]|uniref:Transcription factor domain-containing protein n=1 Tax=Alternaria panax TaxID=48097 RepID=A0AAD4I4Q8_9PLEO|nr:hypothetical protein G6011_07450 [Alternaria panax]
MAPGIIAVDVRHRSTLMKSDWFGTAISNPGFMHSLLATVALHAWVFGKDTIDAILFHRAQAIAAVNAVILTPDGISDANIGAVFNLLTIEQGLRLPFFELHEDHAAQLEIHERGLQRMVQLRGGLGAINTNRILQAFMLWHSTAHAIFNFQAPSPSTLDFISTERFPRHPPGYERHISQHLIDYCRYAGIKESLNVLVESVLFLIADLNVWFSDPESSLDPLDIQNFSCALECFLLTWLRENERLATPLEDALCVALLIFTVRTTEAFNQQSHVHHLHFAASKRLERALNCTIRTEWQNCPDLLLWILSIGAISAEPSPDSTWFVYQTSLACAEFDILSAEALLKRLHLCGWVSYKLNDAVSHLWERVVNLRLAPFFEAPSKAEDADSPAGPLQQHVAEPDLNAWESIDWPTLNLGFDHPNKGQIKDPDDRSTIAEGCGSGAPDESLYTFGSGYAFTCTYSPNRSKFLIPILLGADILGEYIGPTTQHSYSHWMNGSHNHHEQ